MAKICPKCGYEPRPWVPGEQDQCPECKISYNESGGTAGNDSSVETSSSIKYVSTYGTARMIAQIISAVGWLICAAGTLAAILVLVKSMESRYSISMLGLLPALSSAVTGLILVMGGQITRATVDNADHNGEMLAIMKATRLNSIKEKTPSIDNGI